MSHYSGGYAIAIIQNGNVVETSQDSRVAIPFGSDYVIRLINRNGKRAVAKVSVDNQNVSGGGLIVDAHGSIDLQRPTDKAVTFRFASTESKAAEEHGKAGPDVHGDKGLIFAEWRPERTYRPYQTGYLGAFAERRLSSDYEPSRSTLKRCAAIPRGMASAMPTNSPGEAAMGFTPDYSAETLTKTGGGIVSNDSASNMDLSKSGLKSGVTVEGAYSSQMFRTVHFDIDYTVQPIITTIKLMGYVVEEGIPRQGTLYCPSCRTSTKKQTDKFCRQCGERL